MRKIYKHRVSEPFILSLLDRGKMSFATYTNKPKGSILNLLLDGKDVCLFARIRSPKKEDINVRSVDILCTAYHLNIHDRFTFKNKKTEYVFSGWCGIENLPMCHKIGQTDTVYFYPYDEIIKLNP